MHTIDIDLLLLLVLIHDNMYMYNGPCCSRSFVPFAGQQGQDKPDHQRVDLAQKQKAQCLVEKCDDSVVGSPEGVCTGWTQQKVQVHMSELNVQQQKNIQKE